MGDLAQENTQTANTKTNVFTYKFILSSGHAEHEQESVYLVVRCVAFKPRASIKVADTDSKRKMVVHPPFLADFHGKSQIDIPIWPRRNSITKDSAQTITYGTANKEAV